MNHPHPEAPTRPSLTPRGWLFMGIDGGPCDRKCVHCYYAFAPELVFYDLPTLQGLALVQRHYYGLSHTDISGGEPTIYPQIHELVGFCRNIGLKPTIITHGQNLRRAEVCHGIEDAGLEDWLISVHGVGTTHDEVINRRGWDWMWQGIEHTRRPVRFNTTLMELNYRELPELARILVDRAPPTVWNMINFNPFFAWSLKKTIDHQARVSDMAPYIAEAIQIAEAGGFEVNVRYLPMCVALEHGFAKNQVGYLQVPYDKWEWDLCVTENASQEKIYDSGDRESAQIGTAWRITRQRKNNPRCKNCPLVICCDGPTPQYQSRFGIEEFSPPPGYDELLQDPMHFRAAQRQWDPRAAADAPAPIASEPGAPPAERPRSQTTPAAPG